MPVSFTAIASHRPVRLLSLLAAVSTLSVCLPAVARSQDVMDAKTAGYVRDRYLADLDTVHAKVMALANAIPEEKYSWRPAAGVRSISEALMHIATEWYFYTPQSVAMKAPADFGPPRETIPKMEQLTKKTEVLEHLNKSWTHCRAQVMAADPSQLTGTYKPWGTSLPEAAFVMAGDLHEHLGQMIAYARSVGVKPPWSK